MDTFSYIIMAFLILGVLTLVPFIVKDVKRQQREHRQHRAAIEAAVESGVSSCGIRYDGVCWVSFKNGYVHRL